MSRGRRERLGIVLIVAGLLGIVWGVLHVAEAAKGPGLGPTRFEERRGYDQVKVDVHRTLPGGLVRALAGLALAFAGGWLRREPDGLDEAG